MFDQKACHRILTTALVLLFRLKKLSDIGVCLNLVGRLARIRIFEELAQNRSPAKVDLIETHCNASLWQHSVIFFLEISKLYRIYYIIALRYSFSVFHEENCKPFVWAFAIEVKKKYESIFCTEQKLYVKSQPVIIDISLLAVWIQFREIPPVSAENRVSEFLFFLWSSHFGKVLC